MSQQLSEEEQALEASLQQQLEYEEEQAQHEYGTAEHFDHLIDGGEEDENAAAAEAQEAASFAQDQAMDGNGAALANSLLHLNLNTVDPNSHASGGMSGGLGDGSGVGDLPLFKVGECIARTHGVISASKCDQTNGHLYMATTAGEVILFDFHSQRELWRRMVAVENHPFAMSCLDVKGTRLAIGGVDGTTAIYALDTGSVTQVWKDHKGRVSSVAWVGDSFVYSTSHDGYFLVRDADKKGKILHSFCTCTCPLSAMQVESPNMVYIGGWDGVVKKLDLEKKQVSLVLKANANKESPIRCFALSLSPNNKKIKKKAGESDLPIYILYIAHGIGEIKSWDMRTGAIAIDAFQGCNDVVNSMITWNGRLFAASDDKYVRIFDIKSGALLESLSGHENGVTHLEVCGVTPVITPEQAEAALSAAASPRSGSRKSPRGASAPPQQGQGNELLISVGFDAQARAYKFAAIEAAVQLKLLKAEEAKALAFEAYCASKTKGKKKGSRKGSAKGKKKGKSSGKKSKSGSASGSKTGSKKGSKKSSKKTSAANSAAPSARGDAAAAGTGELQQQPSSSGGSAKSKKSASAKKKGSAEKKAAK